MVDKDISKPSTLEIENEKETKLSDIDEFINSLDKNDRLYNDKLNELNKEKNEIISYYDDLSKKYSLSFKIDIKRSVFVIEILRS